MIAFSLASALASPAEPASAAADLLETEIKALEQEELVDTVQAALARLRQSSTPDARAERLRRLGHLVSPDAQDSPSTLVLTHEELEEEDEDALSEWASTDEAAPRLHPLDTSTWSLATTPKHVRYELRLEPTTSSAAQGDRYPWKEGGHACGERLVPEPHGLPGSKVARSRVSSTGLVDGWDAWEAVVKRVHDASRAARQTRRRLGRHVHEHVHQRHVVQSAGPMNRPPVH